MRQQTLSLEWDQMMDEAEAVLKNWQYGAWSRIARHAAKYGSVPADLKVLANIGRTSVSVVEKIWALLGKWFSAAGGALYQLVVAKPQETGIAEPARPSISEVRRAAGQRGAASRWSVRQMAKRVLPFCHAIDDEISEVNKQIIDVESRMAKPVQRANTPRSAAAQASRSKPSDEAVKTVGGWLHDYMRLKKSPDFRPPDARIVREVLLAYGKDDLTELEDYLSDLFDTLRTIPYSYAYFRELVANHFSGGQRAAI